MKKSTTIIALLLSAVMLTACASDTNAEIPTESVATTTTTASDEQTTTTVATTEPIEDEAEQPADTTTVTEATEPVETTTTAPPADTTEAETTTAPAETTTTVATTAATTTEATTTAATTATEPEEEEIVETKYIALTFDDGPNTTTTAEVLDKLEKHDIVASFFLIGNNINDDSAKVVKRAYDMGCEINNHSKSHPYMNEMTVEQIIEEFTYTDDKIFEITGERSKFFRPPYIAVNEDMLVNIDVPFIAGVGCNDWDDKIPADRRAMSILRQVKDGDIILLHDAQGNSKTVEALDTIIPELKAQGYEFVTVSQLFEIKGIEISGLDTKIYTNVLQKYMYN